MKIWNGLDAVPPGRRPFVATIGNYDGVHVGHQAILRAVVESAARRDADSLLVTFDPHPARLLAPERAPALLQTRRQKLDALERTGLAHVLILPFTRELAVLDGESFFAQRLAPRLRLAAVHVVDNFRFGRARSSNIALLRRIGASAGFDVEVVPPVELRGETVSSSAIRRAVAAGEIDHAARQLGRPYAVEGTVVAGAGRGQRLDCPTANLDVENEILPARGVYVTETVVTTVSHPSVTNVGVRPTFSGGVLTVESHLLEFSGDLYDEHVELRFLARVRDERAFSSAAELADQIARDRAAAVSFFHNLQIRPA